jgi:hypothetical protein
LHGSNGSVNGGMLYNNGRLVDDDIDDIESIIRLMAW